MRACPSILFLLSAPSGAGKTSLLHALLQKHPALTLSVSYTTRTPREGEVEGKNYRFVTQEHFEDLIVQEAFAEFAKVHDHYYGTPKSELAAYLEGRGDVVCEIDWQGARAIRQRYPKALSAFVLPPSLGELEKRLIARGKDSAEVIARRVQRAQAEIAHASEYDFQFINDDFGQALQTLEHIFMAAHWLNK